MSYSLTLTRDHDGRRLDRTLRSVWPALPLSAIMRALRKGEVRVDAVRVREPGMRVRTGQELHVPWEAPGARPRVQRRGSVPILWEGATAWILDKPSGLLVQPDAKGGDSVVSRAWSMAEARGIDGSVAAVHRLDRNTTGALIVAIRGDALRALELLFKERRVGKRYLALVAGRAPDAALIDAPLLKDAETELVRPSPQGKEARTRCRRIAGDDEMSLVSVELLTGRTHQARVHLAHIGHPIIGDRKYGRARDGAWPSRRPLLHAFELTFPKDLPVPIDDMSDMTVRAPVPGDMRAIASSRGMDLTKLEGAL